MWTSLRPNNSLKNSNRNKTFQSIAYKVCDCSWCEKNIPIKWNWQYLGDEKVRDWFRDLIILVLRNVLYKIEIGRLWETNWTTRKASVPKSNFWPLDFLIVESVIQKLFPCSMKTHPWPIFSRCINGSDEIWVWEGVGHAEVWGVVPQMKTAKYRQPTT